MTAPRVRPHNFVVHFTVHSSTRDYCMDTPTMDQILDELDSARQRATYGAVAAVVGVSPRALMSGRERNQRHSWVVNLKTGLPTEYTDELMHPELTSNSVVLTTKPDLLAWLSQKDVSTPAEQAA